MLSRTLARIVGPLLIALGVTEALNFDIYVGMTPTVVYLNGTLLFTAGVAIVQAHNRWQPLTPAVVTLFGWLFLLAGLYRMAAPKSAQMVDGPATWITFAVLVVAGAFLCLKGYGRAASQPAA